jgi:hypothetical protein
MEEEVNVGRVIEGSEWVFRIEVEFKERALMQLCDQKSQCYKFNNEGKKYCTVCKRKY